jgi:hypothetical protein
MEEGAWRREEPVAAARRGLSGSNRNREHRCRLQGVDRLLLLLRPVHGCRTLTLLCGKQGGGGRGGRPAQVMKDCKLLAAPWGWAAGFGWGPSSEVVGRYI